MVNTMTAMPTGEVADDLRPGERVDVRSRFVGSWTRGFEIAERLEAGYRLRRLSDGSILPEPVGFDEVRRERRRSGLWWA